MHYLIYMPPFLCFLCNQMKLESAWGYLFTKEGSQLWNAQEIQQAVHQHTTLSLGFPLNTHQWHHMAIAMNRRVLQETSCKVHGIKQSFGQQMNYTVDDSGSELNDFLWREDGQLIPQGVLSRTAHLQASHTPQVSNTVYSNDISLQFGLTDTLLAAYHQVSQQWHEIAGMSDQKSRNK